MIKIIGIKSSEAKGMSKEILNRNFEGACLTNLFIVSGRRQLAKIPVKMAPNYKQILKGIQLRKSQLRH